MEIFQIGFELVFSNLQKNGFETYLPSPDSNGKLFILMT
jgi:hypothetical protein